MSKKKKIIYDLVHGYIEIDNEVEQVINTASFQRLKYISQLTAHHLFPSANHTRFEHSLGVMKIANDAFCQIQNELEQHINEHKSEHENFLEHVTDSTKKHLDYLRLHLQFAALLHDVGHAPLSHVGETFFDKDEIKRKIRPIISPVIIDDNDRNSPIKNGSSHELMSCYVIAKNYKKILDAIFDKHNLRMDLEFIIRIITGSQYVINRKEEYWDRNIIIQLVNGRLFDVDKMDYLMRDNYMTGNVGVHIDDQRLLTSLTIAEKKYVSFKIGALSSLKKLVDCRDSIYMWVCNHHIVVYTDYLYTQCLSHLFSIYQDRDLFTTKEYPEAVNKTDIFSCDAIAEKKVTDNDVYYHLQNAIRLCNQSNNKVHVDTQTLFKQLSGRSFLKPSWKTLFDYTQFIEKFNKRTQQEIVPFIKDDKLRKDLHERIENDLLIPKGEFAIVQRANRFYNNKIKELYIYKNENGTLAPHKLSDMLPIRDYDPLYDDVAFYVFSKENMKEKIMERLIHYLGKL